MELTSDHLPEGERVAMAEDKFQEAQAAMAADRKADAQRLLRIGLAYLAKIHSQIADAVKTASAVRGKAMKLAAAAKAQRGSSKTKRTSKTGAAAAAPPAEPTLTPMQARAQELGSNMNIMYVVCEPIYLC